MAMGFRRRGEGISTEAASSSVDGSAILPGVETEVKPNIRIISGEENRPYADYGTQQLVTTLEELGRRIARAEQDRVAIQQELSQRNQGS